MQGMTSTQDAKRGLLVERGWTSDLDDDEHEIWLHPACQRDVTFTLTAAFRHEMDQAQSLRR